jgi:hypothetical protein
MPKVNVASLVPAMKAATVPGAQLIAMQDVERIWAGARVRRCPRD